MNNEKHIALFYQSGNSDKEYHIHLVQAGSGYHVKIEYGRRGSSLTSSQKTAKPMDLATATTIFDKQVHSKKLKGYTEGVGIAPYVGSDKENKITGVLPQLLNNIEEEDLDDYFTDNNFCLQEKKDGKRILIRFAYGAVEAINRKGLLVGFPTSIEGEVKKLSADCLLDGEMIGETIYFFDILEHAGTDLRQETYKRRYDVLCAAVVPLQSLSLRVVATAFGPQEKRNTFLTLRKQGVEGVVFKRLNAPYKAGRPASKGDQLKFKFTNTCTCLVSGKNEKGKRSVYIQALDGKKLVDVGKVTILPNFEVPENGTLVEVKYLYRHIHGALYQPIYQGVRDDLDIPDQVNTLKVKEGIDIDEEDN